MREIKFRYVLKDRNSEDIVMMSFDLKFIEERGIEGIYESFEENFGGECDCLNESCNHCECEPIFDNYQIISRDEYTGLKDKNGVEIYEGDIIKYKDDNCIVEYFKDMFHMKSTKYINLSPGNYRLDSLHDNYEIIGNIHQNPELLEVT